MLATDAPFSQYFDLDGTPLDGGRIYFGAANQNPETSPVAVYWDAAGTQPAAQPIRTLNGYSVRNGAPALVYTAADYSVMVRNRAGKQVYYVASSATYGNRQQILADLAVFDDPGKGSAMVGYGAGIPYPINTVGWGIQKFISDLADSTDPNKGPALIGFDPDSPYPLTSAGGEIQAASALRAGRTAPHANFSWLAAKYFSVIQSQGPGRAQIDRDISDSFRAEFGSKLAGAAAWVAPTGSDTNGGSNLSDAWLTLSKALSTPGRSFILMMPGTYAPANFQCTDPSGADAKYVYAPFGGVTIEYPGDIISAAVFTSNATYSNVWETTLATANHVTRLLLNTSLDRYGEPIPMPLYSTLVDVNNSAYGWWYDSATKKLYVRHGQANVNTTIKPNLKAIYAPGGDGKIFINSTIALFDNITLHGYFWAFKSASQPKPNLYLKNCNIKYSVTHAILSDGANLVHQGCRAHRPAGDGANYNIGDSIISYGLEIDFKTEACGDTDTYGLDQLTNPQGTGPNKNGSSNHNSYVIRINGRHEDFYGPGVADTSSSYSWCLGTVVGFSRLQAFTAPSNPRYGFLMQGNNAWIDGCSASGNDACFNSDSSANVRIFNSFGTRVSTGSGTFTAYIPS